MAAIPEPQFDELYREIIMDHYRRPRHRGELPDPDFRLEGANPLCGDEILLDVKVVDGRIADVAYHGKGCSISQASASMMTDAVYGHTLDEAEAVKESFKAMMLKGAEPDPMLGDLEALQGVSKFPVRIKCAVLSWNVLEDAIEQARIEKSRSTTAAGGEE